MKENLNKKQKKGHHRLEEQRDINELIAWGKQYKF